jgi:hypothetical protein
MHCHSFAGSIFAHHSFRSAPTIAASCTEQHMHSEVLYPHGMKPLPQGVAAQDILRRLGGPDTIQVAAMTQPSAFVSPQSITYRLDGMCVADVTIDCLIIIVPSASISQIFISPRAVA